MWMNPKTGKGWTDEEEAIFEEIQAVSRLSRVQSIQLWKRFGRSRDKTVAVVKTDYPRATESQLAGLAKGRATQKALRSRVGDGS